MKLNNQINNNKYNFSLRSFSKGDLNLNLNLNLNLSLLFLFLLTLVLNLNLLQAQSEITLHQAVTRALNQNHDIRIAGIQKEIASNAAAPGNAGLLPTISLSSGLNQGIGNSSMTLANGSITDFSGNSTSSGSASLTASYVLWSGGKLKTSYKKLLQNAELSKTMSEQIIENLILQTVQAYYSLSLMEESLDLAKKRLDISKQRYQRTKNRMELGGALTGDLLAAEVDMNSDSMAVLDAKLQVENSNRNFNYIVGNNINDKCSGTNLVATEKDLSYEEIRELAFKNNKALSAAKTSLNLAELDKISAKAAYMPTLSSALNYSYNSSSSELGTTLESSSSSMGGGLNLSWDLFKGFSRSIQKQNSFLMKNIKEEELRKTSVQLENYLQNAWAAYQNNMYSVDISRQNKNTAERNFNRTSELYQRGQITTTQFREAQLNLISSEYRLLSSRYNSKFSEIELWRLSGTLLSRVAEHTGTGK